MEKKSSPFSEQNPLSPKDRLKEASSNPGSPPTAYIKPGPLTTSGSATAILDRPPTRQGTSVQREKGTKTRIIVHYDVGFPNQIYIRGEGANLSWQKGIPLKNIKADEWIFETDAEFHTCTFKMLINDEVFESGEDHMLVSGTTYEYTPHF